MFSGSLTCCCWISIVGCHFLLHVGKVKVIPKLGLLNIARTCCLSTYLTTYYSKTSKFNIGQHTQKDLPKTGSVLSVVCWYHELQKHVPSFLNRWNLLNITSTEASKRQKGFCTDWDPALFALFFSSDWAPSGALQGTKGHLMVC